MSKEYETIKDRLEAQEYEILSPYATKCKDSQGRAIQRVEDYPIRTEFQRDRDRIIHSKAFRRLKHKTQVFLSPSDDHFRTRLTHTLEVSQIGRTLARALKMNEDLVEAISLGHDLGHTPFGHCGESVLNKMTPNGFRHNEQSVRVVTVLEDMNLCQETIDGILTHSWGLKPKTPEAQIVQYADKLAYINHDIEDSILAGIISESDLPLDCQKYFPNKQSDRLQMMITDIIKNSIDKPVVSMSEEGWGYVKKLREWMFKNVYQDATAKAEEPKARHVVAQLYDYYTKEFSKTYEPADVPQMVIDCISCMTDQYAITKYTELFVPKPFSPVMARADLINSKQR